MSDRVVPTAAEEATIKDTAADLAESIVAFVAGYSDLVNVMALMAAFIFVCQRNDNDPIPLLREMADSMGAQA